MYLELCFEFNSKIYSFDILDGEDFTRVFIPNVIHFDIWHASKSNYYYQGYNFLKKSCITRTYVKGKRNLLNDISRIIRKEVLR